MKMLNLRLALNKGWRVRKHGKSQAAFFKSARKLRVYMLCGLVSFIFLLLVCGYYSELLAKALIGVFAVFSFWGMSEYKNLKCPKCGKDYFSGYWFGNLTRNKCSNCGLKMP